MVLVTLRLDFFGRGGGGDWGTDEVRERASAMNHNFN